MSFNKRESETFGHRKSLKLPADDGMQQAAETYSLLDKSKHINYEIPKLDWTPIHACLYRKIYIEF